jgi:hypothetical protein
VVAAFAVDFCMDDFRRPFTAAMFEEQHSGDLHKKKVLAFPHILDYMVSVHRRADRCGDVTRAVTFSNAPVHFHRVRRRPPVPGVAHSTQSWSEPNER